MIHRCLLLFGALLLTTSSLFAGPAAYSKVIVYITTTPGAHNTPDRIRQDPDMVIQINEREWWDSIPWERKRHDANIAKKAGELCMIIDLYHRVQGDPPAFDTLFCSRKFAYSDEGDYINIESMVSETFKFPLGLAVRAK